MATAARKTNWFAIWTSIIVAVIVIGVGAAVVVANNIASNPTAPEASSVNKEDGSVSVGSGKEEVSTYIDFMCPICTQFEQAYGEQLSKLASDDKITLKLHAVAILDRMSQGTNYSTRAANAFYCVAESDSSAVIPFMQALFANQPSENTAGLTDEQLVQMATDAGADIDTCQTDQTFANFVTQQTKKMPSDPETGSTGTPTVLVNGTFTSLGEVGGSATYFTDKFGN